MDILITLASVLSIIIVILYAISFLDISKEVFISSNLKNKLIEVGTNYGDPYLLTQNYIAKNYILFKEIQFIFDEDNTKIDGHIVISPKNVYEYKTPTPMENIDHNSVKMKNIRKKVNAKIIISNYPIVDGNYPITNDNQDNDYPIVDNNPKDCSIADDNYSDGEIHKDNKFTKVDCFVYYKPSKNENLEFCVSSTSKIPLFFVIRNCLFIQKGLDYAYKSLSVLYGNGLRVFDDVKFVNFNVEYF